MTLSGDRVDELFRRLQAIEERPIYLSDIKLGSITTFFKAFGTFLIACVFFSWTTSVFVGDFRHDIKSISDRLSKVELVLFGEKTQIKKVK